MAIVTCYHIRNPSPLLNVYYQRDSITIKSHSDIPHTSSLLGFTGLQNKNEPSDRLTTRGTLNSLFGNYPESFGRLLGNKSCNLSKVSNLSDLVRLYIFFFLFFGGEKRPVNRVHQWGPKGLTKGIRSLPDVGRVRTCLWGSFTNQWDTTVDEQKWFIVLLSVLSQSRKWQHNQCYFFRKSRSLKSIQKFNSLSPFKSFIVWIFLV